MSTPDRHGSSFAGPRRLIWAVNHRTLLQSEVPILRSLGWEVFIPKIIPDHDPSYRSALVTYEYDEHLTVPAAAVQLLNRLAFYEEAWSPTETEIINEFFGVFISSFSFYTTPLSEAARRFAGQTVARVFGREHPLTYSDLPPHTARPDLIQELALLGDRFVFAQGYPNLADIEDPVLSGRKHTVTVPLAPDIYDHRETWMGGSGDAIFLCPGINGGGYYAKVYEGIKTSFGDVAHRIFGRQSGDVDDPAVLAYLSDDELIDLYRTASVFVYPSNEPRHLHYSPIEAMVVGCPVLYRAGSMIDTIAGGLGAGRCVDDSEMRGRAERLIADDQALRDAVIADQQTVVDAFAFELAMSQWAEILP